MGFFSKIKQGLQKTRDSIANGVNSVINSFTKIDEELFEELEETLVMALRRQAKYAKSCGTK